jgi:sugar (pentulose or hexulose) kinase
VHFALPLTRFWKKSTPNASLVRETFVAVTKDGKPLTNALVWMDERAAGLLPAIEQSIHPSEFQEITGKPLAANLSLPKIIWYQKNHPGLISASTLLVDVQAYLVHALTGEWVTSFGSADPMGLFDMRSNTWSCRLLDLAGLSASQLPRLAAPGSILGKVSRQASQACGLPAGLPVIAGLGDGQAGLFGTGIQTAGHAAVSLGTSIIGGFPSEYFVTSHAFRTLCAATQGSYCLETVILSGTYLFDWLFGQFLGMDLHSAHAILEREKIELAAAALPAGSEGLVLVPYWNGAMNPYWDSSASGIVVGWKGIHTPVHLYRAILEGIAYELRLHIQHVVASIKTPITRLTAVGGGSNSQLWLQIIADVVGLPVYQCTNADTASLGAAMLAAVSAGIHPDQSSAVRAMTHSYSAPHLPDAKRAVFYDKVFVNTYTPLFPAVQNCVNALPPTPYETIIS